MINVTMVCGINTNAASKLCAMLGSIGFNGYAPYIDTSAADHRFNSFVSERLSLLIDQLGDSPDSCPEVYVHLKTFSDELEQFEQTLEKKRLYLYHPKLYRLIPHFKHVFAIKVIFVLDSLIEPDNELEQNEWNSYYQLRTDYSSSITSLIENKHFPYFFVNTSEFIKNKTGVFKKIISFHGLKASDDANIFNVLQRESNKLGQRTSPRTKQVKKVAVVTAYAKEPTDTLLKCINSVKNQTVECVHILIADGFPNESIAQLSNNHLLHISLPENIGFNQCGVGVELAFALGFDAVGILDADNWYEPDHIEASLTTINNKNADVAFAKRKVVFPDGDVLSVADPQDNTGVFADTNCLVLTKKVSALAPIWLMWPKVFGAGEDRAVSICTRLLNFNVLMNPHETVWYQTNWAHHYKLQNKEPVAPLRKPAAEFANSFEQKIFFEATGYNLPIKQAGKLAFIDDTDFSKLGIVVSHNESNADIHDASALVKNGRILIVHHESFSTPENSAIKTLKLPEHPNFKDTSWSIGASILFQTGAEALILLDSLKSLDEADFGAMLNLCKQSSVEVMLQSIEVNGVLKLKHVLVTKKAQFFAVVWNQLNHIAPEYLIEACESYLNQKNIRFIHLKK